jgi:hypothetical protein
VHDAISAEKLGIPAACVITDRFGQSARVMAEFLGMPRYLVATIPHPISDNTEQEIRAKAEAVLRQAMGLLLSARGPQPEG